ncbi:MAG: NAD(P)-dependent oxidoreductase [Hyphomicrobiales bacterium]|nr:MAG: NAD(P)-dependent oxidoreductase [Hyphomicrobiales bacterium]
MGKLDGKVVFITGVARGQGRSHALRLAAEGADIIGVDYCRDLEGVPYPLASADDLAETERLLKETGCRAVLSEVDVRDRSALKAAMDAGVSQLGRLDIVLANAGVMAYAPAEDITEVQWNEVVGVDLTGVFWTAQLAIAHLKANGAAGGSIVLTSSTAGMRGLYNCIPYVAAKHGVVGVMRALSNELGPFNIRVNAVVPTGLRSGMIDNQVTVSLFDPENSDGTLESVADKFAAQQALPFPWLEPIDISNAIAFLVSDEGRYITGSEFRVDGGAVTLV